MESSGELCQVKQRGGIGSKNRRNERRQEKIKKEPNRNTKKEENEKEKIEKETEDEKNINNVQTMEEWKNEKEIRKAARLEARAKDDQRRRQYKEEKALFEDGLKKLKDENAIDIKNVMKDENLGKDKNSTSPMDKIGTHDKNVDEVSNTINSENIGKVTNPTKAKVNKIDSKNIDNRKARQHNKNRSLDHAPADTLDLEIFDQLGNLKDKNATMSKQGNISVYTGRQSKALALKRQNQR